MLFSPLIQAQQAHAFSDRRNEDIAEQEARQAEAEQISGIETAVNETDWNPQQDPLSVTSDQFSVDSASISQSRDLRSQISQPQVANLQSLSFFAAIPMQATSGGQ